MTVTSFATPRGDERSIANQELRKKLAPYQAVIDKLNIELASQICIPEDGLYEVYNNVKDLSLEQFESNLRRDYEIAKSAEPETYIDLSKDQMADITYSKESDISQVSEAIPYSVSYAKRQYRDLTEGGRVYLDSEVYSPTSTTYYYSNITGYGYVTFYDRVHFRANYYAYALMESNTLCMVRYDGSMYTADGVNLLVLKTIYVTYNAAHN